MGAIIRSLVMVVTLSIFTGLVYPLAHDRLGASGISQPG